MKKENAIKNRFLDFLKDSEGIPYRVEGEDVKNRTGEKEFDYLLVSDTGQTLALEVTSLIDYPEAFARWTYWWRLTGEIKKNIDKNGLSDRFLVLAPSTFSVSRIALSNMAKSVAYEISETARSMPLTSKKQRIRTQLGHFEITRESDDSSGISFRYRSYSQLDPDDVRRVLKWLERIIESKNRQLDTDADRQVLLVEMVQSYADEQAIKDAFSIADSTRLVNTKEVYVEIGKSNFRKVYDQK